MNARPVSRWATVLLRRLLTAEQFDEVMGDLTERVHDTGGSRWRASRVTLVVVSSVVWHTVRESFRQRRARSSRGGAWLPSPRGVRLAVRRWKARPALVTSAIVTLALGLVATTAMFSILDTVVLRAAPWSEPDRLYNVYVVRPHWQHDPVLSSSWNRGGLSWTSFQDIPKHATTISGFGVWRSDRQTLGGSQAELVHLMMVNAGLFPMLGVVPAQGRFFTPEEDESVSDSVIISSETWRSRFGGRADIVGYSVLLNERPFRIIGVLPPGFRFGAVERAEFLRPLGLTPTSQRTEGNHFLQATVRLAPGVSVDAATRDLEPWVRGSELPERKQTTMVSHVEEEVGSSRRPLVTLLVAAMLLLLIATSNVGALLMGDTEARRHEFAVRMSLGGGPWQLRGQLAVEASVLVVGAAIVAVVLTVWTLPALIRLAPVAMPGLDTVSVDGRILGFAALLTCVVAMLLCSMPLWTLGRVRGADGLREGGRSGSLSKSRGFRWIVAGQTALALILVVGAGLLFETVRQTTSVSLGFDADRLAIATVRLPRIAGLTAEERAQRVQSLVDRVASIPGVESAAATSAAPFSNNNSASGIRLPSRPDARPNASRLIVSDQYFAVMGIRPVEGRLFDVTDRPGRFAAVVTQEFERTFMDGHAVGKTFILNDNTHTIIGVVASPKHRGYTEEAWRGFYLLNRQDPSWDLPTVLVRSAGGDPSALLPDLRRAMNAVEPGAAFSFLGTMDTLLARSVADERFRAQLASAFGVLALLLATIGLYGVVTRAVQARTRELGVRLALGARPSAVAVLVFRHALSLGALGIVAGLPAALVAARAIAAFLYGVAPWSPLVITAATAAVLLATLAAALGPAVRASRIDPLRAIRE
jgi:putative ABC transport system permease protein